MKNELFKMVNQDVDFDQLLTTDNRESSSKDKPSISVNNIDKHYYGDGILTKALDQVTATFYNEITAIVGPSGSGKSTLLSLIGTLDKPTSGNIKFNEKDLESLTGSKLADFRFNHIGFIFQHFELLPTLTALENVMSPLLVRKVTFDKKNRAKELLDMVGLSHKHESLPSQLSGGEQQRVAIARALVNHPQWLLADEPTGNLDSKNSETILKLILNINKETGCGVILVTHDHIFAEHADRIIEMKDGMVLCDNRGEI